MAEIDEKKPRFMQRQWEDLKKSGGLSFSEAEIGRILEGGEEVFSRQELLDRVKNYFASCVKQAIDEDTGQAVTVWARNPTKSGLALCLGISSQTLIDYVKGKNSEDKPYSIDRPDKKRNIAVEDFDILRKAYSLIEMFYEEKLGENRNNAGVIYWLNNTANTKWSNAQEFTFGTAEEEEKTVRTSSQLLADMKRLTQESPMQYLPNLNEEEE